VKFLAKPAQESSNPSAFAAEEQRLGTLLKSVLLALSLLPTIAFAQASELENPGSVSAVQERAYRMNFEFDLAVGSLPLDAFYKGYYGQAGAVVHFSDVFAWQVARGSYSFNVNTGLREQLERDFMVKPTTFDEVQWFIGSDVLLKPFYGKSSVINKWVLHYEAHFILGLSIFKMSVSNFSPAVNLGAGVRLFHTKYVSYRLDVTDNVVVNTRQKPFNVLTIQLMLALNFGTTE
jgi:outer membrane beta-barrel protein